MTTRDDLVAQVEQALRDVPLLMAGDQPLPDIPTMANAAVDQFAIFFYELLAMEKAVTGLSRENIRTIVTSHIGNTFGSGDEIADDIYYDLSEEAKR